MSQFFIEPPGGAPAILTSFTTDFYFDSPDYFAPGTVIPTANNVVISGLFSSVDNENGIQTVADGDNSKFLNIELTNRFSDTITCSASSTTPLLTFDLGNSTSGYRFNFDVIGIDTSTGEVCGYTLLSTFKTLVGVVTLIQSPYIDADEDVTGNSISMTASSPNVVLSFTNSTLNDWSVRFVGSYIKI